MYALTFGVDFENIYIYIVQLLMKYIHVKQLIVEAHVYIRTLFIMIAFNVVAKDVERPKDTSRCTSQRLFRATTTENSVEQDGYPDYTTPHIDTPNPYLHRKPLSGMSQSTKKVFKSTSSGGFKNKGESEHLTRTKSGLVVVSTTITSL